MKYNVKIALENSTTPMLEKLASVRDQSQIIGEFLDYMNTREIEMCEFQEDRDGDGNYFPTRMSIEEMLALFFEIDLKEAEKERQILLDSIRN